MSSKRIIPIIIILLATIFGFYLFQTPCGENIDSTYQSGWKGSLQVKVERKPEACSFAPALAGADYIFSSKQENSEDWQELMTVRHDDPLEISSKSVNIFNETTAAVYMFHKYAVTTDKGETWTVLDIDKDFGIEEFTKKRSISYVNFGENGFVSMGIDAVSDHGRNIDVPFISKDFGKTWKPIGK